MHRQRQYIGMGNAWAVHGHVHMGLGFSNADGTIHPTLRDALCRIPMGTISGFPKNSVEGLGGPWSPFSNPQPLELGSPSSRGRRGQGATNPLPLPRPRPVL